MNHNHEHDEDEENEGIEVILPSWRFSLWDVAGIALHGASGVLVSVGQAAGLLARECAAAANYSRSLRDEREAQAAYEAQQRAIGEDIRALIEGDGS